MSLSGGFNSKWANQDKLGREIKTHEDLRTARIRHDDGSSAEYRGGKMVPGTQTQSGPKQFAKVDVPTTESKFYTPTLISTIVEKQQGDKETVGDKEAAARVRKPIDVNRKSMKL